MTRKQFSPLILLVASLLPEAVSGYTKQPYTGSRIFWDVATETTVFNGAIYSRMIELKDGTLMACAESGGIVVARSYDKGATWSSPVKIAFQPDRVGLCVPDIAQLSDGTIIVGYNPRPSSPWSPERKFGIMAVRSTDNGDTWSEPITIFTASHEGGEGCWEPSFLELPSGELHCYFANEYDFPHSGEQCISLSRSFDGGLTWSAPEWVSFRAGSRDGMPVPVLLQDPDEIVVIIEDNGWGHKAFVATTVRCPLDVNWHDYYVNAGDANRRQIFQTTPPKELISAAPYLRILPNGETVASYMGNEGRPQDGDDYRDMFVEIGDSRAMNFKGRTKPFNMDDRHHSLWNSVAVVDNGTVVAVGSVGEIGKGTSISMIKGYTRDGIDVTYARITPDGSLDEAIWQQNGAEQFVMGAVSRNRSTVDFAFDEDCLYIAAAVADGDIKADETGADHVRLLIDAANVCGTQPGIGMFSICLRADGSITGEKGVGRAWKKMESGELASVKTGISVNPDGYIIEGAIPWTLLGLDGEALPEDMRMAFEIADYNGSVTTIETIPDVISNQSWSWMDVRLQDKEASVAEVAFHDSHSATVSKRNGQVTIRNVSGIADITLYDALGGRHGTLNVNDTDISFQAFSTVGIGIIRYYDGSCEAVKF